jgi:hypothetical protein
VVWSHNLVVVVVVVHSHNPTPTPLFLERLLEEVNKAFDQRFREMEKCLPLSSNRSDAVPQTGAGSILDRNNDATPVCSVDERTSSILVLNGQGISPKATSTSRWKIPAISERYLNSDNLHIPFMCVTETWLKGYITDAQIKVNNYSSFRSDRVIWKGGGTLLFVHDDFLTSNVLTFDDGTCKAVAVNIDTMKSAVVCIYHPPDATTQSFNKLLANVQKYLDDCDQSYQKYVTGDFNVPNINWTSLHVSHTLSW